MQDGQKRPILDPRPNLCLHLPTYKFKDLNTGSITPKESFNKAYVEEVYESEHVRTAIKRLRVILYAKYEKSNLHKIM